MSMIFKVLPLSLRRCEGDRDVDVDEKPKKIKTRVFGAYLKAYIDMAL